jgi:sulfotransferase family protein
MLFGVMASEAIIGACADCLFAARRSLLGPYRVRRTRLYCVGLAKSGTHSIAAMFSKNVRASHEAQSTAVIERIIDWREGRLGDEAMSEWVRARDRELALEVDSSLLNSEFLEILLSEFPDALFVLTLRDCYSWLNSLVNHWSRDKASPAWIKFREWRWNLNSSVHAPEERVLKEHGARTLDYYFSQWATRNNHIIATVPAHRLLIVRTDQITRRALEIADFAGLPRRAVRLQQTHAFSNPAKQEIICQIDPDFLEQQVAKHCRPLMTRFFPEIKSLSDARL